MAVVAVYLGETNEDKINDMSFKFFNSVLHALGKRLNYEAVANLYGNAFAKDAGKAIQDCNPLYKPAKVGRGMMTMLDQINIVETKQNAADGEDEFVSALFNEEAISAANSETKDDEGE